MGLIKVKYKNMRVPESLYESVKSLAEKEQRMPWEVVLDAISYYETLKRKPRLKEDFPAIEKITWYIVKLATAVAFYVATNKIDNYYASLSSIEVTEKRLGVDMKLLVDVLTSYKNSKRKTARKRANVYKALKMVIQEMIVKHLAQSTEETATQSAG